MIGTRVRAEESCGTSVEDKMGEGSKRMDKAVANSEGLERIFER
jgi:hypothetical protein